MFQCVQIISKCGQVCYLQCNQIDVGGHRTGDKVLEAREQIEDNTFRKSSPTVKEYCEKWLLLQSAQVRATTLTDYTSKVNRHIIKPLGHMNIADVTADDIRLALVPVSKKSASVYKSVNILYKSIFAAVKESKVI